MIYHKKNYFPRKKIYSIKPPSESCPPQRKKNKTKKTSPPHFGSFWRGLGTPRQRLPGPAPWNEFDNEVDGDDDIENYDGEDDDDDVDDPTWQASDYLGQLPWDLEWNNCLQQTHSLGSAPSLSILKYNHFDLGSDNNHHICAWKKSLNCIISKIITYHCLF